jgi:5-methylcytosine-specific restriction endonuclease McrA
MAVEIICRKDALAIGRIRYFTNKPCKYGHIAERWSCDGQCVECVRVFQTKHKEEYLARHKKWRDKNNHKVRAWNNRWRFANPEKKIAIDAAYNAANIDILRPKKRFYQSRRHARKLNAAGSHTLEQVSELFKKQKGKCLNCRISIKIRYHVDHIMPLSKGGSNYISNIQLLCPRCNIKKYNKDPIEWAQENGRLL